MFGYPDFDAGLNISWFFEVMAFPKPMRHSTLNNRDSGVETMAITIVIVLTTIPMRQIFMFPTVHAIVLRRTKNCWKFPEALNLLLQKAQGLVDFEEILVFKCKHRSFFVSRFNVPSISM